MFDQGDESRHNTECQDPKQPSQHPDSSDVYSHLLISVVTCFAVMSCLVHCTCDGSGHGMLLAATFADLRLDLSSKRRDITRLFCHSNSFLLSDVDFDLLHSLHVFCCHASQLFLRDL